MFKIAQKYKALYMKIEVCLYSSEQEEIFCSSSKIRRKIRRISIGKLRIFILLKVTWLHNIAFSRHQLKRFTLCAMYCTSTIHRGHTVAFPWQQRLRGCATMNRYGHIAYLAGWFRCMTEEQKSVQSDERLEPLSITRHDN